MRDSKAPRSPRGDELTTKRIAAAAIAVADERGVGGFTMRAVADVLGVTPMALYHHVEDKAALVALAVDAVISERELPASTGSWREDLLVMARWTREITCAHPAMARLRSTYHVWTPSIFPMTERWLSIWQQSGLDLESSHVAASASGTAIMGFVEEELILRHVKPPDNALLGSFPNARIAFNTTYDRDQAFEMVVGSVIDGLHARLVQPDGGPSKARRGSVRPGRQRRSTSPAPRRHTSRTDTESRSS